MFLTFTPYAASLCFLSARHKGGDRLSLVIRWKMVASGFLVDDSGFDSLCSKVEEFQQLVTVWDVGVRLAICMSLPFEHGDRIEF